MVTGTNAVKTFAFALLVLASSALAFVTAKFDAPAYVVAPGGTIQLTLTFQSTERLLGTTYRFEGNYLSIFARDVTGSPFSDLTVTEVRGAFGPDLGGTVDPITASTPPGEVFVASYILNVSPDAPAGSFKISLGANSVAVNEGFAGVPVFSSADVLIVPEPPLILGLFAGLCLLRFRPYERRRKNHHP